MNGIQPDTADDSIPVELERWIESARQGNAKALGEALAQCRDYLLLVADDRLGLELRSKTNPSDLVQETFLRAVRHFESFRGRTAGEWRVWLRKILERNLAEHARQFAATAKRELRREIALDRFTNIEISTESESPSRSLGRLEREAALFCALDRLAPHYRDVVVWHHRDQRSFEEIALTIGKTPEAARKLWTRALIHLRKELGPAHDPRR